MIANKEGGVSSRVRGSIHSTSSHRSPSSHDGDLEAALERTRSWLLSRQHADGHWVGELEGDTILESEYVLLLAFLGRETEPICARLRRYMLDLQLPGGRLGDLPGRAGRDQRLGEGLLRAEAGGVLADDPAIVRGPRGHSRGGRRPGLQQLHAVLPGAARADRLRRMPERSARDWC